MLLYVKISEKNINININIDINHFCEVLPNWELPGVRASPCLRLSPGKYYFLIWQDPYKQAFPAVSLDHVLQLAISGQNFYVSDSKLILSRMLKPLLIACLIIGPPDKVSHKPCIQVTQGALVVYMMYKVVHNPCEQMTQGTVVEYKVFHKP